MMRARLITWLLAMAGMVGWASPEVPEPFGVNEVAIANYPDGEVSYWSGKRSGSRYTHHWLGYEMLEAGRIYDGAQHWLWGMVDEFPGKTLVFISNGIDNHGETCFLADYDPALRPDMRAELAAMGVDLNKMAGGVGG